METLPLRRVLSAERHRGGLLITFDNSQTALYSAALLYSIFPQASEVLEPFAQAPLGAN
jgi:hypothetical protein